MKLLKLLVMAVCCVLIAGSLSVKTRADEYNKKTIFTFSGPVEIPGYRQPMVLPAGTYVFKLLDSMSDRDIVQIFNKDQTHLYATILAIPDYRMQPTGRTVVTFAERAEGSPEALKAWFYPGDQFGQEFVYPKARAIELAKSTNEPVLSMPDETASNFSEPVNSAQAPAAEALEKTPVNAEQPNGQEEEESQVVQTTPSSDNTVAQNDSKTLPKTGSEIPLSVLLGTLLFGFGAGLRFLSRKIA